MFHYLIGNKFFCTIKLISVNNEYGKSKKVLQKNVAWDHNLTQVTVHQL